MDCICHDEKETTGGNGDDDGENYDNLDDVDAKEKMTLNRR